MKAMALIALAGFAGAASANVVISEILGSTSGSDWEFIEIVNTGNSAIDITGWSIELWDSDAGAAFGTADGFGPYAVLGNVVLGAGQTYVWANSLAEAGYGFISDALIPGNAIENSSYTAILADAGSSIVDSVFVTDGSDPADAANRAGASITANLTVGPDGTFLPAGFARTDNVGGFTILNFSTGDLNNGTLEGGTPGSNQIPAPAGLALLGVAAMAAGRRR